MGPIQISQRAGIATFALLLRSNKNGPINGATIINSLNHTSSNDTFLLVPILKKLVCMLSVETLEKFIRLKKNIGR